RGGYGVRTLVDSFGQVSAAYGVKGLPVLYFVDSDGIVRSVSTGLMNLEALVKKVETLIKGTGV
ncbi:MAG: hypothetical protein WC767_02105, partial [Candidatus Paceibacterota bacterium]